MDDLEKRLDAILSDPESMSRLSALAQEYLGGHDECADPDNADAGGSGGGGLSAGNLDLNVLLKVKNALSGSGQDDSSRLLLALRPYLRPRRQQKVDEAAKLMRLIKLAPLLKESQKL